MGLQKRSSSSAKASSLDDRLPDAGGSPPSILVSSTSSKKSYPTVGTFLVLVLFRAAMAPTFRPHFEYGPNSVQGYHHIIAIVGIILSYLWLTHLSGKLKYVASSYGPSPTSGWARHMTNKASSDFPQFPTLICVGCA